MRRLRHVVITLTIVISLWVIFPRTVYAYIDPGMGSIIIQVIIGALVGGLVTISRFWRKVKTFFGNLFTRGRGDEDSK